MQAKCPLNYLARPRRSTQPRYSGCGRKIVRLGPTNFLGQCGAALKGCRMTDDPGSTRDEERAKQDARRARQRAENTSRAARMHVARLAWERQTRLDEPPTADGPTAPEFHVGCSGWFYWHWRGSFYPVDLPTREWFAHYADMFETVELNAPFYSWPTVATVKSWVRQAGRREFLYTVKACELITHVKRLSGTKALVRDFGHIADLLGPRFGCFLFQLPPSFHYTPTRLAGILDQLDPARRNVVEFRHQSWWNERVYDAFRQSGTIFCSCSAPRLPDELVKTADDVYVRFHGPKRWYWHDYTRAELAVWKERIKASGASRVWAYFNNDRDANAVRNSRELLRLLCTTRDVSNSRSEHVPGNF
jgi:uncharacterized protein YecE (DUF72 family)